MAIVITGGAGFIGSNLVHALNARGREDLIVVDDMSNAAKVRNISSAVVADYLDKAEFRELIDAGGAGFDDVSAVLHHGACSRTDVSDGKYLLDNNFTYSKRVLRFCLDRAIPLVYASSASVYGRSTHMSERATNERPLNAYAYSKLLFDQHVRNVLPSTGSQVVGLRYFNVYGRRERHKGSMASMVTQMIDAARDGRPIVLFDRSLGHGAGEHRRDFVHADDVVATALWFLDHPERSGIFNCGTGESRSFNDVAALVTSRHGGLVEYCPMPDQFADSYQPRTEADLHLLRAAGCGVRFRPLESGISDLLDDAGVQERA